MRNTTGKENSRQRQLISLSLRLLLAVGVGLVLLAWGATRIPFLRHYYAPCAVPDFGSYVNLVLDLFKGVPPVFSDRTPGYPLFIALIYGTFGTNYALVFAQALFKLAAVLVLVFAVYRFFRPAALLAGAGMALFLYHREEITNDFSLMSESIYTSMLMLTVAALLLAIRSGRPLYWAAMSSAMAGVIFIRPAGMFLLPANLLLLLWIIWNRPQRRWAEAAACTLPMAVLLTALCVYNSLTAGYFGISAYGEANLAGATSYFWHDHPDYPPKLRAALRRPIESLKPEQAKALAESWDFETLYPIYSETYNLNLYSFLYPYLQSDFAAEFSLSTDDPKQLYHAKRELKRRISFDAIEANPQAYLKFIATQLYGYFWHNTRWKYGDFYDYPLPLCHKALFTDRSYAPNNSEEWRRNVLRDYYEPQPLGGIQTVEVNGKIESRLVETRPLLMQRKLQKLLAPIINWRWWDMTIFVVLALALFKLLWTGLRSPSAAALTILALMVIGHALLVSLVEISLTRYILPLEFINFIGCALLPALLMKEPRPPSR